MPENRVISGFFRVCRCIDFSIQNLYTPKMLKKHAILRFSGIFRGSGVYRMYRFFSGGLNRKNFWKILIGKWLLKTLLNCWKLERVFNKVFNNLVRVCWKLRQRISGWCVRIIPARIFGRCIMFVIFCCVWKNWIFFRAYGLDKCS